jgi:nucleotidyltransferase/DNA polymerase involved in DNA repair
VHAALAAEAERAGLELRSRGVFARTLTLRLRFADGRAAARTTPLNEATALDDALLATARELLPRLWTGDRPIRAVGISCAGVLAATGEAALFALQPM